MFALNALKSTRNTVLSFGGRNGCVLYEIRLMPASIQRCLTLRSTHNNCKKYYYAKFRPKSSRPEHWYADYPIALIGKRQSPINIVTKDCILNDRDLKLDPLVIEYPKQFNDLVLKNPRDDKFFGWRADVFNEVEEAGVSGGPLEHSYRLAQFHCHWGKTCGCGSEHTIDGNRYSAELHFVHWNKDLYATPHEALHSPNGLTVIAVFLQTSDETNEELNKLSQIMHKIKYKGERVVVKQPIDVLALMPQNKAYWTYSGSLTTPPLWETVTWIIFKQPVLCTEQQIESFRQLSYIQTTNSEGCHHNDRDYDPIDCVNVEENYRTQQPLNDRKIIFVKKC